MKDLCLLLMSWNMGLTHEHNISSTPECQKIYQLSLHNSTRVSEQA